MTSYLIAVIDTDRVPSGEYREGRIVPSGEVRDCLYTALSDHGRVTPAIHNAQMIQESETAVWLADRWRGEPMRLCGYLVRYDVYITDGPATAQEWARLAAEYDAKTLRRAARERIRREWGLAQDDPDYGAVLDYLMTAGGTGASLGMAVRDLEGFRALAVRPDVAAAISPPYRPWQWAAATAALARDERTSIDVIERELLAEIAARTGEAMTDTELTPVTELYVRCSYPRRARRVRHLPAPR
jgi:hypothetical protein